MSLELAFLSEVLAYFFMALAIWSSTYAYVSKNIPEWPVGDIIGILTAVRVLLVICMFFHFTAVMLASI